MGGLKLFPEVQDYGSTVALYLIEDRGERRFAGRNVEMAEFQDGEIVSPAFRISRSAAQELFEQLWSQGFRSPRDKGNAEALDAARQEHIGDLRKAAKLA